jgi:hypothetical protein|tara:strand:+ start:2338 stop:2553 length:216 start_codon:yes stop_codon:yes gene_type:complete
VSQEETARKNELELVAIRGEIKLLAQKIESLKTNDFRHLQASINNIYKILWGVVFIVLGELIVGLRMVIWG